jgi:hypothetical protein
VPFPGEIIPPKSDTAPPATHMGGRGSVGGELMAWGKWMALRNSFRALLMPAGHARLHVECLSFLHTRFASYVQQRFHELGVDRELHIRLGNMYRRLADPEGACTWRGATHERALLALPHHFRGAGLADVAAHLLLDLGYVTACVCMGLGRNVTVELQLSIHRALVDTSPPPPSRSLSTKTTVQLVQMLLWLSRSMLALSSFPDLTFQSAANEPWGTAPHILSTRRLLRGWEGGNWFQLIRPSKPKKAVKAVKAASFNSDHDRQALNPTNKAATPADVAGVSYRTFAAHRGSVRALAVSTCATLWASAGDDGIFKIFNSHGTVAATLGEADVHGRRLRATAVAFSPDSTLLATASLAGGVHLYDTSSGLECASFMVKQVLNPDEVAQKLRRQAMEEAMKRANPAGTSEVAEVWGFPLNCLAFSRSGALILAGCADGNCHIFEVSTSACRVRLVRASSGGPRGGAAAAAVRCCSWSIQDQLAASGGADRRVVLWRTPFAATFAAKDTHDKRPGTQVRVFGGVREGGIRPTLPAGTGQEYAARTCARLPLRSFV